MYRYFGSGEVVVGWSGRCVLCRWFGCVVFVVGYCLLNGVFVFCVEYVLVNGLMVNMCLFDLIEFFYWGVGLYVWFFFVFFLF